MSVRRPTHTSTWIVLASLLAACSVEDRPFGDIVDSDALGGKQNGDGDGDTSGDGDGDMSGDGDASSSGGDTSGDGDGDTSGSGGAPSGDGDGDTNTGGAPSGDGDGDTGSGGAAAGGSDSGGTGSGGDASGGSSSGGSSSGGNSGTGGNFPADCEVIQFTARAGFAKESSEKLHVQLTNTLEGAGLAVDLLLLYQAGAGVTTPASSSVHKFSSWEPRETCGTCVLIYECANIGVIDPDICTVFEVYDGELDVAGNENGTGPGDFAFGLNGVVAKQVTINNSDISTEVPNGRTLCINQNIVQLATTSP